MATSKMTARDFYSAVIEANISDEMNAKAKELIEALDRRNEKRKSTETKNQKANSELKNSILTAFQNNEIETIDSCITTKTTTSYLNKAFPNPDDPFTTQKTTALLGQLEKTGELVSRVVKAKSGKVKGYALPETVEN